MDVAFLDAIMISAIILLLQWSFEGNITGAFSMEAFTATGGRLTCIMGTKGWLKGDMKKFEVTDFLTNKHSVWNQDISSLPDMRGMQVVTLALSKILF